MKKTTSTVFFASLITLLGFCSVLFYSCEKIKSNPFYIYVTNPFAFDILIAGDLNGCTEEEGGCLFYEGKIFEGKTPGQGGTVYAYNYETHEEVGKVSYDGDMESGYTWTAGYGNPLVKIESSSGNGGGSNGGSNGGNSGGNNGGSNGGNNGGNNGGSNGGSGDGYFTLYQDDPATVPTKVEIIGPHGYQSQKVAITKYYKQNQVECGSTGCANFTLPPGNYYYEVYFDGLPYGPIGPFKITSGECVKARVDSSY